MCGFCRDSKYPVRMASLIHYGFSSEHLERTVPKFETPEIAEFSAWQWREKVKELIERTLLNFKLRRFYANRSNQHTQGS
jgi:hypothetical protein